MHKQEDLSWWKNKQLQHLNTITQTYIEQLLLGALIRKGLMACVHVFLLISMVLIRVMLGNSQSCFICINYCQFGFSLINLFS